MVDFKEFEDCLPRYGALCTSGERVTVRDVWLLEFARNIVAKERAESVQEIEKLRGCLLASKIAMESANPTSDWSGLAEHINDVLLSNV